MKKPRSGRIGLCAPAICGALLAALLLASPGALRAQTVSVTAGEHAGFTRLVLQAAGGFDWRLETDGPNPRLVVGERTLRLEPGRLFQRIPRTRLADLRSQDGALVLGLACPCPIRAWQERPGLVVIDIRDPGPQDSPLAPLPLPAGLGTLRPSEREARLAGHALAAAWPAHSDPRDAQALAPESTAMLQRFSDQLIRDFAAAMTRGLIEPARPTGTAAGLLPAVALPSDGELPPNIRLQAADDPRRFGQEDVPTLPDCPPQTLLAFAGETAPSDFVARLADLHQGLYGEFDQPVGETVGQLAEHYLAWGFGAEARLILDNAADAMPGRDLLVAVSDILEDRQSNARQRLAGLSACGGPTTLFAALAGAPMPEVATSSDEITYAYLATPPGLRLALGEQLIEVLIAAGALDQARMALAALERVAEPGNADLTRLAARIDQARGQTERAALRLDARSSYRTQDLRLRLEIALERGEAVPEGLLDDAVALAESDRQLATGRQAMELAILHHARAGRAQTGLALIDRLEGWLEPTPSAALTLADLRATLWAAASELPDPQFLETILSRNDWRNPDLPAETRSQLAGRFATLGLTTLAAELRPDGTADPEAPPPPATEAREPAAEPERGARTPLAPLQTGERVPAAPPWLAASPGLPDSLSMRRAAIGAGGPGEQANPGGPVIPLPGRGSETRVSVAAPAVPVQDVTGPQPVVASPGAAVPVLESAAAAPAGPAAAAPPPAALDVPAPAPAAALPPVAVAEAMALEPSLETADPMRQGQAALANSARLRTALGALDLEDP